MSGGYLLRSLLLSTAIFCLIFVCLTLTSAANFLFVSLCSNHQLQSLFVLSGHMTFQARRFFTLTFKLGLKTNSLFWLNFYYFRVVVIATVVEAKLTWSFLLLYVQLNSISSSKFSSLFSTVTPLLLTLVSRFVRVHELLTSFV